MQEHPESGVQEARLAQPRRRNVMNTCLSALSDSIVRICEQLEIYIVSSNRLSGVAGELIRDFIAEFGDAAIMMVR